MLGISTCWKSKQIDDGNKLLDSMLESGISALELEYRISESMRRQIWKRLNSSEFKVLSIHNFFPIPEGLLRDRASADFFLFSSPDKEERNLAVKHGLKTLHYAADLEARAVVFHLGRVAMEDEIEKIWAFFDNDAIQTDEAEEWREKKLTERAAKAEPYLDAVLKSLDRLNEEAAKLGLIIGAENRLRLHQIPFLDEFDIIFKEFTGGAIRYWHDCGHAEIMDRYGFLHHENDLLAKYAEHLGGFHFHDVIGRKDHRAPGMGDLDFEMIAKYVKPDTIRILEVHDMVGPEEIERGVEILNEKGLA